MGMENHYIFKDDDHASIYRFPTHHAGAAHRRNHAARTTCAANREPKTRLPMLGNVVSRATAILRPHTGLHMAGHEPPAWAAACSHATCYAAHHTGAAHRPTPTTRHAGAANRGDKAAMLVVQTVPILSATHHTCPANRATPAAHHASAANREHSYMLPMQAAQKLKLLLTRFIRFIALNRN